MSRRLRPAHPITIQDKLARVPGWGWLGGALLMAVGIGLAGQGAPWSLGLGVVLALPLAGAGAISILHRRTLAERARAEHAAKGPDILQGMGWREFEVLISESFRLRGYRVVEIIGGGPEHSFDIVLSRMQRSYLAHCRPLIGERLGDEIVRELDARRGVRGASGGMVVSGARFTREAVRCAKERHITLISGSALRALLSQARELRQSATRSQRSHGAQGHPDAAVEPPHHA